MRFGELPGVSWLVVATVLRRHISRFGAYATDDLARRPEAFNPVLEEVDFTPPALAA